MCQSQFQAWGTWVQIPMPNNYFIQYEREVERVINRNGAAFRRRLGGPWPS